jgi:hypothetical protein
MELRFGLNNVSPETEALVCEYIAQFPHPENVTVLQGEPPNFKYPMMRRLFAAKPLQTQYVMWYDDDSWVSKQAPADWFQQISRVMQQSDMIGAMYMRRVEGNQKLFIEDQPWYAGKPVRGRFDFITGGWWTIKTEILTKHDWPIKELQHNGGDAMLGELCRQQGYVMRNCHHHVHINADDTGKCSTARRRGFSQPMIGCNYKRTGQ